MNWLQEILKEHQHESLYATLSSAFTKEALKEYIPKERFNEVNTERKMYKDQVKAYETKVDTLETQVQYIQNEKMSFEEQLSTLQNTITENESQLQSQRENHQQELQDFKLQAKIENRLLSEQVRNQKAILPLLSLESISLSETGELTGLDEQLTKLKESDAYLFETKVQGTSPQNNGSTGYAITKEDFSKMGYKAKVELYTSNKALFESLSK